MTLLVVTGLKIGHAGSPRPGQDLTARRDGLAALGVGAERVYVDHGLTGTTCPRPGLREALAASRTGDTLVVTRLDRLAWSLPNARDIVDELTPAASVSSSAVACTTQPVRSVGCCSTCWPWSPSPSRLDLIADPGGPGGRPSRGQARRPPAQADFRPRSPPGRPAQRPQQEPSGPGRAVRLQRPRRAPVRAGTTAPLPHPDGPTSSTNMAHAAWREAT
jgi:hypothetical protein